jgi:hypothetical protein
MCLGPMERRKDASHLCSLSISTSAFTSLLYSRDIKPVCKNGRKRPSQRSSVDILEHRRQKIHFLIERVLKSQRREDGAFEAGQFHLTGDSFPWPTGNTALPKGRDLRSKQLAGVAAGVHTFAGLTRLCFHLEVERGSRQEYCQKLRIFARGERFPSG